jgi:prevent-host-death family protein
VTRGFGIDIGLSVVQNSTYNWEVEMQVSVSDAKGQLTELVRRAEAGDDVVLTRHGKAIARIVPLSKRPTQQEKRSILEKISHAAAAKATPGAKAARSQDFLYNDETGLPK